MTQQSGSSVPERHKARAPRSVGCFVATASDSRTTATDTAGQAICTALQAAGHVVLRHRVVQDDSGAIQFVLDEACGMEGVAAVILTGGTGISRRDNTADVVGRFLEKTLPGFGELFRWLSYQEIGSAAYLSRALAGVARGRVVFALPGSEKAVRLAMEQLILPELGHLIEEVSR